MDKTQLLETIVKAADDKRAEDIVALDMEGVSLLADYFVIMNGNSERQVQAIVDGVEDAVMAAGGNQPRIEGKKRLSLDVDGLQRHRGACLCARRTRILQLGEALV